MFGIGDKVAKVANNFVDTAGGIISEYVEDKDKANELNHKLKELHYKDVASAREHDRATYGIEVVDTVRGLIRPIITAGITCLYVHVKLSDTMSMTDYDYAILGLVLGFWFGGRELQKVVTKLKG